MAVNGLTLRFDIYRLKCTIGLVAVPMVVGSPGDVSWGFNVWPQCVVWVGSGVSVEIHWLGICAYIRTGAT